MARALSRLLLLTLMIAAACGPSADDAAAGAQHDTGGQAAQQQAAQQAAAPSAGRDTAEARAAVLRLGEELGQAMVRGDSSAAQRILAEDYVGVTMDGHSETKAEAIANIRGASETIAEGTLQTDSTTVRVHGDAAVVRTRGTFRVRGGQPSGTRRFRTTDVFVWRGGQWQVVASHVSPGA